jgi:hypothetical protein
MLAVLHTLAQVDAVHNLSVLYSVHIFNIQSLMLASKTF